MKAPICAIEAMIGMLLHQALWYEMWDNTSNKLSHVILLRVLDNIRCAWASGLADILLDNIDSTLASSTQHQFSVFLELSAMYTHTCSGYFPFNQEHLILFEKIWSIHIQGPSAGLARMLLYQDDQYNRSSIHCKTVLIYEKIVRR